MNETWDLEKREFIYTPLKMTNFFDELDKLCLKYNLSISHEDGHGSFIIEEYKETNMNWLRNANKAY